MRVPYRTFGPGKDSSFADLLRGRGGPSGVGILS